MVFVREGHQGEKPVGVTRVGMVMTKKETRAKSYALNLTKESAHMGSAASLTTGVEFAINSVMVRLIARKLITT